jgi:hypothetical protein
MAHAPGSKAYIAPEMCRRFLHTTGAQQGWNCGVRLRKTSFVTKASRAMRHMAPVTRGSRPWAAVTASHDAAR